ncbi:MAG: hypothetical protein ABSG13_06250 [Bryobacteraceae bacterium]
MRSVRYGLGRQAVRLRVLAHDFPPFRAEGFSSGVTRVHAISLQGLH